jgi:hypothetical protein
MPSCRHADIIGKLHQNQLCLLDIGQVFRHRFRTADGLHFIRDAGDDGRRVHPVCMPVHFIPALPERFDEEACIKPCQLTDLRIPMRFNFSAVLPPMPYISFTGSGQSFVGMSRPHSSVMPTREAFLVISQLMKKAFLSPKNMTLCREYLSRRSAVLSWSSPNVCAILDRNDTLDRKIRKPRRRWI